MTTPLEVCETLFSVRREDIHPSRRSPHAARLRRAFMWLMRYGQSPLLRSDYEIAQILDYASPSGVLAQLRLTVPPPLSSPIPALYRTALASDLLPSPLTPEAAEQFVEAIHAEEE